MNIPKEVIVVEGRDDTKRLIETFGNQIKTIETNGSAIPRKTLKLIQAAAQKFGVIVFTDPDYQGERIRRIVGEHVPQAKHAYLSQDQADSGHIGQSLGVEHASPEVIKLALENVMEIDNNKPMELIKTADLMDLGLIGHPQSKDLRQVISEHFHLGHINGKQLQKKLAQYQIDLPTLQAFIKEIDHE